jgi:hypothetical protein
MAVHATERNLIHMFRSKQEPCTSPHCLSGAKCPRAHSVADWCPPVWLHYKHDQCFSRWTDDLALEVAVKNNFKFKQTAVDYHLHISDYHSKKSREIVKSYLAFAGSSACDFVYDDNGKLVGSTRPLPVQLPVAQPVDPVEAELEIARQEYEQKCEQIRKRAALLKEKEELLKKVNEWRERAKDILSAEQLIM